MDSVRDWIDSLIDNRKVCGDYADKVDGAISRAQMMDIVLDANGISFIPEMESKGYELPYESIISEYGGFVNGRYKRSKDGYTSSMYVLCEDDVDVDTTITCFLGCKCWVILPEFSFREIYLDKNCDVKLSVPSSSRVSIHTWEGAKIDFSGCSGDVKVTHHT